MSTLLKQVYLKTIFEGVAVKVSSTRPNALQIEGRGLPIRAVSNGARGKGWGELVRIERGQGLRDSGLRAEG